jgi:hypothetical protein
VSETPDQLPAEADNVLPGTGVPLIVGAAVFAGGC